MKVLPDNKLLFTKYSILRNGEPAQNIIKLNEDGSIDTTFLYTKISLENKKLWIENNGRILVTNVGSSNSSNLTFRLNRDGKTDSTFHEFGSILGTAICTINDTGDESLNKKNSKTAVYPNPTNGSITLEYTGNSDAQFSVIELTGELVFSQKIQKGKIDLDLKNLNKGIYFYVIKQINNNSETGKIIFY